MLFFALCLTLAYVCREYHLYLCQFLHANTFLLNVLFKLDLFPWNTYIQQRSINKPLYLSYSRILTTFLGFSTVHNVYKYVFVETKQPPNSTHIFVQLFFDTVAAAVDDFCHQLKFDFLFDIKYIYAIEIINHNNKQIYFDSAEKK